jgi:hypothetical protein
VREALPDDYREEISFSGDNYSEGENTLYFNPNENDQGRKGPCFFSKAYYLKCLMCQKIQKKISNPPLGSYLVIEPNLCLIS